MKRMQRKVKEQRRQIREREKKKEFSYKEDRDLFIREKDVPFFLDIENINEDLVEKLTKNKLRLFDVQDIQNELEQLTED